MTPSSHKPWPPVAICTWIAIVLAAPNLLPESARGQTVDPATSRPAEGIRQPGGELLALRNARVVVGPGEVLDGATVIVQRDTIRAVGVDITIPPGAEVIPMNGKTIYAGLVDVGGEAEPVTTGTPAAHWNRMVTPHHRPSVPTTGGDAIANASALRGQGITTQLIAPSGGIFSGESHAVLTGGPNWMSPVLKESVAQHLQLTVPRRGGGGFPGSPMGAVALVRQTMIDADWYRQASQASRSDRKSSAPAYDPVLQKIADAIQSQDFIIDCPNERFIGRADQVAREFSFRAVLKGSGREYQLLERVVAADRTVLVPVAFPKPPNVSTAQAVDDLTLTELMHWHLAPENPGKLAAAGVPIALTTAGLDKPADFLPSVRKAVKRGLPADQALAAMTTVPAKLIGLDDRIGTVAVGKLANLIVVAGDLLADDGKVVETWVAGRRYRHTAEPTPAERLQRLDGKWTVQLTPPKNDTSELELSISFKAAEKDKPARVEAAVSLEATEAVEQPQPQEKSDSAESAGAAESAVAEGERRKPTRRVAKLDDLIAQRDRFTATLDVGKLAADLPTGFAPVTILVGPATTADDGGGFRLSGSIIWPDGDVSELVIEPAAVVGPDSDSDAASDASAAVGDADKKEGASQPKAETSPTDEDTSDASLVFPLPRPLGASGRVSLPEQPAEVIFSGATLWTCGPEGILEKSDVLVRAGKIVEVGTGLVKKYVTDAASPPQVVDASGMHITPGLIDCHSHIATDGGVNEATRAVTADVRISDFIDHTDISIYRQLAGGLTTSNILHGSANPIGGQNQVIKLRWGSDPDGLKFASAPQGIKFALGENVKRNTWRDGSESRYPQSRMGVEQLLRDRFIAAREYDQLWRNWRSGDRVDLPPRRDLRLEALAEILRGERWIHCHSYRQDEIAALLGVLQEFNVQIGTLQHILEGYKVAEVLAESRAMASTFADWWAYKVEVYDAIPYNAALLKGRGIVVSMNSDDAELGRHLNTEAAKAIKYGGVEEEDALKMVTLNPAKQLRIDDRVGSIEVGKDADLVIWSGRPLSTTSRCEQTWIDGRPYFTRENDALRRQEEASIRAKLIQAVFAAKKQPTGGAGNATAKPGDGSATEESAPANRLVAEEDRWHRIDIYCSARGGRLTPAAARESLEKDSGNADTTRSQ